MPTWGDAGFRPGARVPHVLGADGRMAAVLFSFPLVAAPEGQPTNKILWVVREPLDGPTSLVIEAQLEGTGPVVRRVVANGPGPSSVDMPLPGCWRMSLTWADQRETIDLAYTSGTGPATSGTG